MTRKREHFINGILAVINSPSFPTYTGSGYVSQASFGTGSPQNDSDDETGEDTRTEQ